MFLQKLYKRDSKGKTREWNIEIQSDQYRTVAGIIGKKLVVSNWTTAKRKNIGKSNETTGEEQALKKAKSKWQDKFDTEYHDNIRGIDVEKFYQPMLAHKFKEQAKKLPERILYSPKLDGIRIVIKPDGCFSRTGKHLPALDCIRAKFDKFFEAHPNGKLDGEAYNHKFKHDFEKIVSLCKKQTEEELEEFLPEIARLVIPHLFDVPSIGNLREKDPFHIRWAELKKQAPDLGIDPSWLIEYTEGNKSDVEKMNEHYVSEGYEGTMIRDPDGPYEKKRSYLLQKYKDFIDEEFEILEIIEGEGNRSGMMGHCIMKMSDGRTFKASSKGGFELYRRMLSSPADYVYKMATVRYQNLTKEGKPRFGVIHSIRDYE